MEKHQLDEYSKLDDAEIERVLFTNENVEQFLLYQKSVEIISIVKNPQLRSNVIKFNLVNRSDAPIMIQVVVYDEEMREKIRAFVIDGNVLYLDRIFVNKKHPIFSSSNILYDLVVSTNTKFNLIKEAPKYQNDDVGSRPSVVTDIRNCLKHTGPIQIIDWFKQKISVNRQLNTGCLSDCVRYKIEVRMGSSCDMTQFQPGDHVKMTGIFKYNNMIPYILVQHNSDISSASEEKKSARDYLKGASVPKRPVDVNHNETHNPLKKKCLDG